VAVVWSLPREEQAFLPEECILPHFYVNTWIPQAALLATGRIEVAVCHCGWGGCLDCVEHGVPVAAFPLFGDQPANAIKLEQLGLGRVLQPASLRQEDVTSIVSGLLRDEKLKVRCKEFQSTFRNQAEGAACEAIGRVEALLSEHSDGAKADSHGGRWGVFAASLTLFTLVALLVGLAAIAFGSSSWGLGPGL